MEKCLWRRKCAVFHSHNILHQPRIPKTEKDFEPKWAPSSDEAEEWLPNQTEPGGIKDSRQAVRLKKKILDTFSSAWTPGVCGHLNDVTMKWHLPLHHTCVRQFSLMYSIPQ
eukprot:1152183-Pelagomonas_calceolata.AAC.8